MAVPKGIAAHGYPGTPLWVTEFGLSTTGPGAVPDRQGRRSSLSTSSCARCPAFPSSSSTACSTSFLATPTGRPGWASSATAGRRSPRIARWQGAHGAPALPLTPAPWAPRYPCCVVPSRAVEGPGPPTPQQPAKIRGSRRGANAGDDGGDQQLNTDNASDRDYLAAVRERVVVFDGGMGATLEQFDLTQEDYGGLPGKCHEALVLNRPDVIEGVHTSMLEAGAEVRRDRHLPGQPAQARRVGARRAHARDQHQGRRDRPQGRGRGPLRRRLDRPDRLPAGLRRPDPRRHLASASWSRSSPSRPAAWSTAAPTC